jgi:FtsP/CotA-like multicopper oxidase with cupredoxin domain
MKPNLMKIAKWCTGFLVSQAVVSVLWTMPAHAAAPGIKGPNFSLVAEPAYITQPDGQVIYSWGYGCDGSPSAYLPQKITGFCNSMQIPGPTLIVSEGDTVTVTLRNALPSSAGNTSILFPGFQVSSSGGASGLMTREAQPGGTVSYTFKATTPGTRSYYSGTQGDLQIEMGLYGAIIVLPATAPASCDHTQNDNARGAYLRAANLGDESDFRLAHAAYNNDKTCYDREYLFQFSEVDPRIHEAALAQVNAKGGCTAGQAGCSLQVPTEPYHPAYFMINGRSMPDDMDPNYSPQYPHQPYNGNPHLHPGELILLRVIGQGRWQHPFHEHANHVRILARDGNLILAPDKENLAGPALFTTTTTPGEAMDGIFYYTGRGLNWDMYGHNPSSGDALAKLPCVPDSNGYNTAGAAVQSLNYYEWCQDHNKPMQVSPFGDVPSGGPVTLPDPNILVNGAWYGGSPYLGPDATVRSNGPTGTTPPSGTIGNSPSDEAGFAFMWHSHNEREITTNNAFPGGMMMMMLVDSREFAIDESN